MLRISSLIPCATIAFSVAAGAASAAVPLTAASNASAFNTVLNLDGQVVSLGRQVYAGGNAPPTYNSKNSVPSYSKNYQTPSGVGALVAGGSIISTASSAGPSGGQITSDARVTMGTFNATVTTPLGALISIHGGNIVSHSSFSKTRAGVGTPSGNANIGNVTINGPLLGINNKQFSGAPKVNQVLYQSPDKSVTVYLNRQTETMVRGKPTSITVDAIAIEFSKAVQSSAIGADIVVGESMAN
jgi:hypothetical protein